MLSFHKGLFYRSTFDRLHSFFKELMKDVNCLTTGSLLVYGGLKETLKSIIKSTYDPIISLFHKG